MSERIIRHAPRELIGFETLFKEDPRFSPDFTRDDESVPPEFRKMLDEFAASHEVAKDAPEKRGRFERFDYTTDVYEDGKTYKKYAMVYLPWCYDPSDREKKYRVIYFQHGNGQQPGLFTADWLKVLFDRLFLDEKIEPCILVCTTYYFDPDGDKEARTHGGQAPAGDGNYPGVKPNFWREITQSLIPKLETHYNTYLTDASDASVRAARSYRLFSGYSRGCVATWYMFHNALPYFEWFVPMSCMTTVGKGFRAPLTEEDVLSYLAAPVKENPGLKFFIFACNGGEKDIKAMTEQMKYVTKAPWVSYGTDPDKNNMFFCASDYFHGDFFAPQYYHNALPVIWPETDK